MPMLSPVGPDENSAQAQSDIHGSQEEPDKPLCVTGSQPKQSDAERCLAQRGGGDGQGARDVSVPHQGGQY